MKTKNYWQTMDGDGKVSIFTFRPVLDACQCFEPSSGHRNIIYTFPIQLKPLQIAEITVNENGTWSYEIEREEGLYVVTHADNSMSVRRYKNGCWLYGNSGRACGLAAPDRVSKTRIPDECII